MAYERAALEAIISGDSRRMEAIRRLNTPGSYRDYYNWDDEINDKLLALSGKNSSEIFAHSLPRRR